MNSLKFPQNTMTTEYKLSQGSLQTIMNGGNVSEPIMQILRSKKINSNVTDKERFRIVLSDGKNTVNVAMVSVPSNDHVLIDALQMFSIIQLERYVSSVFKTKEKKDSQILLILELKLIAKGDLVGYTVGEPTPLTDFEIAGSQSSEISVTPIKTKKKERSNQISRAKVISPISSLSPFHNRWVIKARVTNKTTVRTWSNSKGEGNFFTVDLVDGSGEIRCTAFRELVEQFFDCLEVDKVYYISKCQLRASNRQFVSLRSEFEMTFTNESIIEESLNNNDDIPQIKYNFTSIDKVANMDAGTTVDVIGLCKLASELKTFTAKSSNRELKKKEVLLVDQSNTAISLTLWGNDAESFNETSNPVVLIKGAKICEFRGSKTLSVPMGSQIKLSPNIPETQKLRNWYDSEGAQVEVNNVSVRSGLDTLPWMMFKEIQEGNLAMSEKGVYFRTFGTILLVRLDRAVYKACPTPDCMKKVIDLENGLYRCEKCNRQFSNFRYRLLVSMNISDSSSSQWVTMFSSEAEKILGKTAQEIGETLENDPDSVAKIFEDVQFKQFVFKCRAKMETFNDEQRIKTIVVKVEPVNFEEYHKYLVQKIELFNEMIEN